MVTQVTLEDLPYDYKALEPHIDEETLHVHHDKHHQTYTDKFNAALEAEKIEKEDIKKIFNNVSQYSMAIRNHGGGYWNHQFYWESMTGDFKEAEGAILEKINAQWGSFDKFKEEFSKAAAGLFGSGWTWLGVKADGSLIIHNTQNQDNTYMDLIAEKYEPLLVIDVWEHAYYIKYQNKRPEYIENFFNVINWAKVNERLKEAQK